MSEDVTNQILKLIEPVLQHDYRGNGIDVGRVVGALRRVSKLAFLQDVCDWHIACEKEGWRSQASVRIEFDDEARPYISDSDTSLLDEQEQDMAQRLVEIIDEAGTAEPRIEGFVDRIIREENKSAWSTVDWRDRLMPFAGMEGLDIGAYCSQKMAQDLDEDVQRADQARTPGPRM